MYLGVFGCPFIAFGCMWSFVGGVWLSLVVSSLHVVVFLVAVCLRLLYVVLCGCIWLYLCASLLSFVVCCCA